MLDRVAGLYSAASSPCEDGQFFCNTTWRVSGNAALSENADIWIGRPVAIVGLLVVALLVRWLLHRLVDRVIKRAQHGAIADKLSTAADRLNPATAARRGQRAETIGSLLKSVITGVVVVVVGTMMLDQVGVNIAPIIASAGIVGVALGFGAQSLVKDFLSGIFIIFEDQYGVGDIVDLGDAVGTVEAVSLRVTRLRAVDGTVWYVPNGEIMRVGNQSQNWSRTVLDIGVAYSEDLTRVRAVLEDIAHGMWEDDDYRGQVIEEPSVWGVQELAIDQVTMRLVLKTTPGAQWAVAREMRQRIKARFDHEGIEIPFPQRVVWQRHDPAGAEAPASGGTGGTAQ